jgi:hypothetical protein
MYKIKIDQNAFISKPRRHPMIGIIAPRLLKLFCFNVILINSGILPQPQMPFGSLSFSAEVNQL